MCAMTTIAQKKLLPKNNGTEMPRGQRPITADDFYYLIDAIENPDTIRRASQDYIGGRGANPQPGIEFEKTLPNGRTIVFTYVSEKHKDLAVQTVYGWPSKGGLARSPRGESSFAHTSETHPSTASDSIISDAEANINQEEGSIATAPRYSETSRITSETLSGTASTDTIPETIQDDNQKEDLATVPGEQAPNNMNESTSGTASDSIMPNASEDDNVTVNAMLDQLLDRYGMIPRGEKPKTDFVAPAQSSPGHDVNRFARTMGESGGLTGERMDALKSATIAGHLSHIRQSNYLSSGIKTEAGIDRIIPVSPMISMIIKKRVERVDPYLFTRDGNNKMTANYFRDNYFYAALDEMGIRCQHQKSQHITCHTVQTRFF